MGKKILSKNLSKGYQNAQNFKLSNFYFINIFDISNGLVRKCKKPDDVF